MLHTSKLADQRRRIAKEEKATFFRQKRSCAASFYKLRKTLIYIIKFWLHDLDSNQGPSD